jgi:hypothetical protein
MDNTLMLSSWRIIPRYMARPPFKLLFQEVWSYTLRAVREAPGFVLFATVLYLISEVIRFCVPSDDVTSKLIRLSFDTTAAFLLIPFEIAIYRLLILGEKPSRYQLEFTSVRFRRYLVWGGILWMLGSVLELLPSPDNLASVSMIFIWVFGLVILFVRLALLLPAVAAGPEHVTARDAIQDTKGHVWLIFSALLIAFIPAVATSIVSMVLVAFGWIVDMSELTLWEAVPRMILLAAVQVATVLMGLVAVARMFHWIGDRVKRGMPVSQ